jgi:5-methylcytosine-specific restriction endonuclease McrA
MPPAVADAVIVRANGACEACGFALCGEGHLHHRKKRSQGGKHTVENLIYVSALCHSTIHENPTLAYKLGLMVKREFDPADIPVRRFGSTILDEAS